MKFRSLFKKSQPLLKALLGQTILSSQDYQPAATLMGDAHGRGRSPGPHSQAAQEDRFEKATLFPSRDM